MTTVTRTVIAHDQENRLVHDGETILVETVAHRVPVGLGYGSTLEHYMTTRATALEFARLVLGDGAKLGGYLGSAYVLNRGHERIWTVTAPATSPDELDALMGITELPVRVLPGAVVVQAGDVYSPDLVHVEGAPAGEDVEGIPDGWTLLTGYSGQDRYAGPVMHASEMIGGRMAEDILSTPGVYTATTVEVDPTDDEPDPFPAGWAVARRLDA
jgi:hypothetical protein